MQSTYSIQGMRCGSCVARVKGALQGLADSVDVTLSPAQAILTHAKPLKLDALNAAVQGVGKYTLAPATESPAIVAVRQWLTTYRPLLLIAGYISVASFAGGPENWMVNFMAGFFLVFSFFKLIHLKGFAEVYATYDVLAKRWPTYGLFYPFIELGLGLAYLFRFQLEVANLVTLALMLFGSVGVGLALRSKKHIRCACLGSTLNLPMTTVTLIENGLMVLMAIYMLI